LTENTEDVKLNLETFPLKEDDMLSVIGALVGLLLGILISYVSNLFTPFMNGGQSHGPELLLLISVLVICSSVGGLMGMVVVSLWRYLD